MTVLITGATGFLGSRIAELLVERGVPVRALVRNSSNVTYLESLDVELVRGTLNPPHALEQALTGIKKIVHCAGGGYALSSRDFYDNNLTTTQHLLECAKTACPDLERFVFVSSLAAHGPSSNGQPRDPNEPGTPITHYGKSKAAAELLVLESKDTFPVTVIRPPAIYGPGDRRLLPLFRSASRGFIFLPSASHSTSLIHVDDCARAIISTLETPHPSGRRYFVEDGEQRTFDSLARTIGDAVGRTARVFRIPGAILFLAALLTELWAQIRRKPALLTRDKVRDLSQPYWVCDASALRTELKWSPQVDFPKGARETARWYRSQGWIR